MSREEQALAFAEQCFPPSEVKTKEMLNDYAKNLFIRAVKWADENPLWHKASDDLPQKDDMLWSMNVLVTDGDSIQFGVYNRENNHWHVLGFEDGYQYNVTHWMYLPKLPEIWNN
jgi:hypothetical protein